MLRAKIRVSVMVSFHVYTTLSVHATHSVWGLDVLLRGLFHEFSKAHVEVVLSEDL